MSRILTSICIHRPIAEVFDYVTTPANWPVWHPASIAVSGSSDHPLRLGEEVVEEFRRRRTARVGHLAGDQAKGPISLAHRGVLATGAGGNHLPAFARGRRHRVRARSQLRDTERWLALLDILVLRRHADRVNQQSPHRPAAPEGGAQGGSAADRMDARQTVRTYKPSPPAADGAGIVWLQKDRERRWTTIGGPETERQQGNREGSTIFLFFGEERREAIEVRTGQLLRFVNPVPDRVTKGGSYFQCRAVR